MRDCHPWPWLLKYSRTSGLYRIETSTFGFSSFGRPRMDLRGTIDLSCSSVSGCASGSLRAAAVILRSSSGVGRMNRCLPTASVLGVLVDFLLTGMSQADDSYRVTAVNESGKIKTVAPRHQTTHSHFVVSE